MQFQKDDALNSEEYKSEESSGLELDVLFKENCTREDDLKQRE